MNLTSKYILGSTTMNRIVKEAGMPLSSDVQCVCQLQMNT